MAQHDAVYATLVMTDDYLPGAMVLGHSLRDRGAKAKLAACVLLNRLSLDTINELQTVYDDLIPVDQIVNEQPANLYLMNRPDLISTFTKIELWKQTQYRRIVYLDADMVVLRAPNELLTKQTSFAAVPDVGWPDCFNSGMMVLNPDMGDYYSLKALAQRGISFDGADQGLLNMHFTDWDRLSFTYNCTPSANYQYVPAYKHFQSSISMIHFIGADKPWKQGRDYRVNGGVYGELLGRWWSVYDRHYRRPKTSSLNEYTQPQKRVQDYVHGEERIYEPPPPTQPQDQAQSTRRPSSGYQITQPHPQDPPGIHVSAPSDNHAAMEQPFGDQPGREERIEHANYEPRSTQDQRRYSAPHAQWDAARQPPPPNSQPEASNFPTKQYDFNESTQLFEPPAEYPEPPKDMWYQVPDTKPKPTAPPRTIFPWEERATKPTRVFPKSREPTPSPPEDDPEQAVSSRDAHADEVKQARKGQKPRRESLTKAIEEAFAHAPQPQQHPQPPTHIFPWEARAPKPTRVFPQERPPSPPPNTQTVPTLGSSTPDSAGTTDPSRDGSITMKSPTSLWDEFAQQSNKWDEDPDIARFMEGFNKPRRVPVQVVHDSREKSNDTLSPLPVKERRTSLKLTDFPTEIERPSLPVTPAPIRRPTFWGDDESQNEPNRSVLPVAEGVPSQDEWNPIIKLEELQRKQSLLMSGENNTVSSGAKTPPRRLMPESSSAEEAMKAAIRGMNVQPEKLKQPAKPILKEPHFEMTSANDDELGNESLVPSAHMTVTGSKSPTRFNPIVLEGEAASESSTFSNHESYASEATTDISPRVSNSAKQFAYSTSSLSPEATRTTTFDDEARKVVENYGDMGADADVDTISPTTVA